jgi:alpha-L-fucosidase
LEINTAESAGFDRAVMSEQLNGGQRVQRYSVEAWNGEAWRVLSSGTTIGHKKIDIFPRTSARMVRLRIIAASGEPLIRDFRVY